MKNVKLLVAGAISAFVVMNAFQAAANTCYEDCPEEPPECLSTSCEPEEKGDNGWGNGADTTNNGSTKGATALTKENNGLTQPRLGPIPAVHERFLGR